MRAGPERGAARTRGGTLGSALGRPGRSPGPLVALRARVVIVEDGRVALIKRVREGRTYYLFPGGGVEDGESAEQAAVREAREELGVDVELSETLHTEDFQGVPFVYFAARIVGGELGTGLWPDHADRDEETRERHGTYAAAWVPLSELDDASVGLDVRPVELLAILRGR